MTGERGRSRLSHRAPRSKAVRPRLEVLEDRFLLYATTGNQWTMPNLITYSFMPDGTSLGGVPSNLQATLNAHFATASWQAQISDAAAVWEKVANVNLSLVTDNGSPLGVSGNQQDDPRFGDIRIGGYAMSSSILAFAYLPPPANGGTDAGDIFFNTAQPWQINGTTYDLMTVAIHELGHALGMGHSTDTSAAMYPAYITSKQAVDADDISGIRSIYNARQSDIFNTTTSNNSPRFAANISSYIGTNAQLTISGLDLTPPVTIGTNDIEWYQITVPASTTGTMVVRMQSTVPEPAVPEPRRLQFGGKHDTRATGFLQPGRYSHGRDQECVSRPGLRYPVPGLNDREFGLRGVWTPGEFRLAHPARRSRAQHHRGPGAGQGRRHAERELASVNGEHQPRECWASGSPWAASRVGATP